MISSNDLRPLVSLTKDLVADQTYTGLNRKLNVTATGFDATKGLGQNAADTSTAVLVNMGGFDDMKITSRLAYGSFTSAANADIGVLVRCTSLDTPINGYYARMDGGQCRITRVTNGSFTNLTSSAMSCAADDTMEISLSVVGDLLTATFENVTADPGNVLTLTATDSTYTTGGMMGIRSFSSTLWIRSFTAEQL